MADKEAPKPKRRRSNNNGGKKGGLLGRALSAAGGAATGALGGAASALVEETYGENTSKLFDGSLVGVGLLAEIALPGGMARDVCVNLARGVAGKVGAEKARSLVKKHRENQAQAQAKQAEEAATRKAAELQAAQEQYWRENLRQEQEARA